VENLRPPRHALHDLDLAGKENTEGPTWLAFPENVTSRWVAAPLGQLGQIAEVGRLQSAKKCVPGEDGSWIEGHSVIGLLGRDDLIPFDPSGA